MDTRMKEAGEKEIKARERKKKRNRNEREGDNRKMRRLRAFEEK